MQAPPPLAALATIDDRGQVTLNWDLIRAEAHKAKAEGGDFTTWGLARALMVAHGEDPDGLMLPTGTASCVTNNAGCHGVELFSGPTSVQVPNFSPYATVVRPQ